MHQLNAVMSKVGQQRIQMMKTKTCEEHDSTV